MPSAGPAILIRGGRVIDPARQFDAKADVMVRSGRVERISSTPISDGGATAIDADGCLVCPGLIDPHVHLREPGGEHKETIRTGAEAAIAGGFTSICCMPNTTPALDLPSLVDFVRLKAKEAGLARVFVAAAGTIGREGEKLSPIGAMANAGAVAFTDDGVGIADSAVMQRVLLTCKAAKRAWMQHCQDAALTGEASMNSGAIAAKLGLTGWPAIAEELMLERDVRLNRAIGCRYHAQHVSSAGSVEIIRRARAEGQPVSGEASPHHLLLTDDACDGWNTIAKVNPPLRRPADIESLRKAVADGTLEVLATDHAPHTASEKARDFSAAPFGCIGLESALPMYAKALIESGLMKWPEMIQRMTVGPARLLGLLEDGFGRLFEGGPADVTVIDIDTKVTVDSSTFRSMSRNCPFHGMQGTGRPRAVVVHGKLFDLARADWFEAA
ncbi:MAG: dihydroorotase [Planctomycetes bacterium]|nr:dihydroorotase [Planctomycetota bacterium]